MSSPPSLPSDPTLAAIAVELEKTGWSAGICDPEWKMLWISEEFKSLLDEHDEDKLGYGRHLLEAYLSDPWMRTITTASAVKHAVEAFPLMVEGTPGGAETLQAIIGEVVQKWSDEEPERLKEMYDVGGEKLVDVLYEITPVEAPPIWAFDLEFVRKGLPPVLVNYVEIKTHDRDGRFLGRVILYGSGLPATVTDLLYRGDKGMYERMARLIDPGRRQAAVLFADLQTSTSLSRRLPSAAYFGLIKALTTALDQVVVDHEGIVGKHAGDGLTAFFLAEDIGTSSAAAAAAIESARSICDVAERVAKDIAGETGLFDADECKMNVGVHWGGTLYMGQLVTGGRLEVTALGDNVNECARIQESARDGVALASKTLIEHLTDDDATRLGIDADSLVYKTVADLPGATEKAARDAGGIPVAVL
jgi:class 3 adenylate cyclase